MVIRIWQRFQCEDDGELTESDPLIAPNPFNYQGAAEPFLCYDFNYIICYVFLLLIVTSLKKFFFLY